MQFAKTLLSFLFLTGFPFSLEAARFEVSPLTAYFDAHNAIAVLQVKSKLRENRIDFANVKSIFGEVESTVVIETSPETFKNLEKGKQYLIVYTKYQKNPLIRKVTEVIPTGPKVISSNFIGDAVFAPTKNLLAIVSAAKSGLHTTKNTRVADANNAMNDKVFIDLLIQEMKNDSEANRRFAKVELSRHPALLSKLEKSQGQQLMQLVSQQAWPEKHLVPLVDGSIQQPSIIDSDVKTVCLNFIAKMPEKMNLRSMQPQLALSCTSLLRRLGNKEDIKLLVSLLSKNNPGVAKAAFKSMRAINAERSHSVVEQLLNSQVELLPEVRRFLTRQLKLHQTAVR